MKMNLLPLILLASNSVNLSAGTIDDNGGAIPVGELGLAPVVVDAPPPVKRLFKNPV